MSLNAAWVREDRAAPDAQPLPSILSQTFAFLPGRHVRDSRRVQNVGALSPFPIPNIFWRSRSATAMPGRATRRRNRAS